MTCRREKSWGFGRKRGSCTFCMVSYLAQWCWSSILTNHLSLWSAHAPAMCRRRFPSCRLLVSQCPHSGFCFTCCCSCAPGVVQNTAHPFDQRLRVNDRGVGLNMMSQQIHLSGNPVPWDIDRGSSHQELFVMLHTKEPEYVNWAVRVDRDTHSITHITAGPLLRNQDYRNEVGATYVFFICCSHEYHCWPVLWPGCLE